MAFRWVESFGENESYIKCLVPDVSYSSLSEMIADYQANNGIIVDNVSDKEKTDLTSQDAPSGEFMVANGNKYFNKVGKQWSMSFTLKNDNTTFGSASGWSPNGRFITIAVDDDVQKAVFFDSFPSSNTSTSVKLNAVYTTVTTEFKLLSAYQWINGAETPTTGDGLDTTFRISIDGLTYPQYKLNWVHTGASEYMDSATIHLRAVNTWTDLTDSLNLSTTIEDKINLFNASSKLIKDIDYGVRGSEYLFSYQGIINDGGIENFINSLTKKGITIGMYISLEVDDITYYSNIVQATLYKDGTSIDTMWDYVFNYIFTGNNLLLGFNEWTESDEDNHDDDPQDENDDDDPSGGGGDNDPNPTPALHTNGTLTTSYSVTYNHLKSLGAKIWNESFYSSLLKINSNPIENIISCKAIPVSVGGTEKNIVLGNVDTGITGKICDESYSLLVGSITIKGRKSRSYDFLDYEPYTNLSIYLPFIGIKKLDTSICMGRTLKVVYNIDVITGTCRAMIYINGYVMYSFNGNCGVDIPISSMNRAQVEMGFLSSLVGVAGGAGIATVGMAMNNPYAVINGAANSIQSGLNMASSQYNTTTNGTSSPNIDFNINRKCYIIYDRPVLYNDLLTDTFYHTNGRVSHKTRKLLQLRGYTEISPNTDLKIKCTTDELEELRNILSSGFIIKNFN